MQFTKVFHKLAKAKKRIVISQGGTSSSKTFSELQKEIILAQKYQSQGIADVTSIVSESIPHLKRGAIRDFLNIMKSEGIFDPKRWNKSNFTYNLDPYQIEFFSVEDEMRVRGGRRRRLFINEVNNTRFETFQQLEVRTREQVTVDYNPSSEFWIHTEVIPHFEHDYIHSTYKDNQYLEESIIKSIESRQHQENWWKVYGLGEVGNLEGVVFKDWKIKEIPSQAKLLGYGLDFGYTNDPTALTAIYMCDNEIYLKELIYSTGLTNQDICVEMRKLRVKEYMDIIADSSEPKSIDEIAREGFCCRGAEKGKDSISFGIDVLNQYKINITPESLNIIKEFRNYQWATDKAGKALNKPIDNWNHSIDGIRYFCMMNLARSVKTGYKHTKATGGHTANLMEEVF